MFDDGDPGGIGVFHLRDFHALDALLGVLQGKKVGQVSQGKTLQTDTQTGFIHHLEHELNSLAFLPEDIPVALPIISEIQGRGRRTLEAHLMLDAAAIHIVGFS